MASAPAATCLSSIGRLPGEAVVRRALAQFAAHPAVDLVQPVIHRDDLARFAQVTTGLRVQPPVFGGTTRQASVLAGLEALATSAPGIVLVHDAARPFLSSDLISHAIDAGARGAAVPALMLTDTVKAIDAGGRVIETLDRAKLRTVQTPQAFAYDKLLAAHRKAATAGRSDFPDDAALAEWAGLTVTVFAGEAANVKLTTAEDFMRAQAAENANGLAISAPVRVSTLMCLVRAIM